MDTPTHIYNEYGPKGDEYEEPKIWQPWQVQEALEHASELEDQIEIQDNHCPHDYKRKEADWYTCKICGKNVNHSQYLDWEASSDTIPF